jgi:hypothetical protein
VTDPTADAQPDAPASPDATLSLSRVDLEALIDARVEARTEAYRRKVNGELAGFRKRFIAADEPGTAAPNSPADPQSLLSLGARLARLDEAQRSSLMERFGGTPDVLAGVLDVLETSAPAPPAAAPQSQPTGTGRPQPQPTTRGAPPAPAGSGLPIPRTVVEYRDQVRGNPKRASELLDLADFDPTILPQR